jgi:hypothetical protein
MLWVGLGVVALIAATGAAAIALFRSYERTQQQEIEDLQSEIEEIARWVDTDS